MVRRDAGDFHGPRREINRVSASQREFTTRPEGWLSLPHRHGIMTGTGPVVSTFQSECPTLSLQSDRRHESGTRREEGPGAPLRDGGLSIAAARRAVRELREAIAARAHEERAIEQEYRAAVERERAAFAEAVEAAEAAFAAESERIERDRLIRAEEIERRFAADHAKLQRAYDEARERVRTDYDAAAEACRQAHQDARWMVQSVYDDATEDNPKHRLETFKAQLATTRERVAALWSELEEVQQRAAALAHRRHLPQQPGTAPDDPAPQDACEALDRFDHAAQRARERFERFERDALSRAFSDWRPLLWFMIVVGGTAGTALWRLSPAAIGWSLTPHDWRWPASCVGLGLAVFFALVGPCWLIARSRGTRLLRQFETQLLRARSARRQWRQITQREYERLADDYRRCHGQLLEEREAALKKADKTYREKMTALQRRFQSEMAAVETRFPPQLAELERVRERLLKENAADCDGRRQRLQRTHRETMAQLQAEHDRRLAEFESRRAARWSAMEKRWRAAIARTAEISDRMCRAVAVRFPAWDTIAPQRWRLPDDVPPAVPFGEFDVRLEHWPEGLPRDSTLMPERTAFPLPALLASPERPSLVIHTAGPGRREAVALLQSVMLRLLLGLPPGKVRFTIVDPVGLGENFATFMHLADFDEKLVNGRIWTEPAQIEQRLADLTEHMETVLQKYLRNEFATIQEYNAFAGEVAEPYHVLVVCGFPAGFTDRAAQRLSSIAGSGPRCGVLTLLSIDDRSKMPAGFDPSDLHQHAAVLRWQDERFVDQDPDFADLPLRVETPPPPETFGELVKAAGRQSQDARRVEVPFERIAPPDEELWSRDSRTGIDVPLGRAGAMKLQRLRLGEGTLQHVLVAGKTGSGKSSFLHVLITNLALYYGPDEIEFYLIDFKKGVEFKTYATHGLPHARVIAIESDREFGVSVLQRLDVVLKERGDAFRACGVQDIRQFRDARPEARMPRILLIIDEFQEFFVEDDRYAQTAALLLDRLVRQGRAFGIHVLLGSQTLGGAYSLARTTLGQMAVRIALQCSEADAHLILSEENTAARLLSRPGEAIYNDANGLLEGNHPFQIAWLPENTRNVQLQRIQRLRERHRIELPPPIVFEGNVPADPAANPEYVAVLRGRGSTTADGTARAWIGDAVAITGAVAVQLRRQPGAHLLVVGRSEDSALGILANAALSLAWQRAAGAPGRTTPGERNTGPGTCETADQPPSLVVLDGSRPEDAGHAAWPQLVARLGPTCRRIDPSGPVEETIDGLLAEVERREHETDEAPPMFVVIYGLARFRQLRKAEDDFGFGLDRDKPASLSKRFADLLRRGPLVGVHTLVWCDSYNNLTRWLPRDAIREFESRVALAMSANDSSNLIESPVAARLGPHRAYLYEEASGTLVKFRPYAAGTAAWFDWIDRTCDAETGPSAGPTSNAAAGPPENADTAATEDAATDPNDDAVERLDEWTIL
ncbi:MAG: cell division protein FtsK [Planctomycetota bacterium]|nr:MAG: cell division protein FtsK [Planctomycetota bacterium]